MELIVRILLLASAAISFAVGVYKFFRSKTALFKILVTASIGCSMLGRLYELVTLIIRGEIPSIFNIGMLATLGAFLFIFSASYSQMDGLVDDKSAGLSKYRLTALIAPVVIMAIACLNFKAELSLGLTIFIMVLYLVIAVASYYNLKHVIIPDVSFGIIASIKAYSIAALVLELFTAIQILADKLGIEMLWTVSSILIAITYPIVLIAMDRGSKKWTL